MYIPERTHIQIQATNVQKLAPKANGQISLGVANQVHGINNNPQIKTHSLNSLVEVKEPIFVSMSDEICFEAKSSSTTQPPNNVVNTQTSTSILPGFPNVSKPMIG